MSIHEVVNVDGRVRILRSDFGSFFDMSPIEAVELAEGIIEVARDAALWSVRDAEMRKATALAVLENAREGVERVESSVARIRRVCERTREAE